jgi:hypothetical protein
LSTCQACNFIGTCSLAKELCAETTNSRLVSDATLACETVMPYFAPVSALMFIGIVFGIPSMFKPFWKVTNGQQCFIILRDLIIAS